MFPGELQLKNCRPLSVLTTFYFDLTFLPNHFFFMATKKPLPIFIADQKERHDSNIQSGVELQIFGEHIYVVFGFNRVICVRIKHSLSSL